MKNIKKYFYNDRFSPQLVIDEMLDEMIFKDNKIEIRSDIIFDLIKKSYKKYINKDKKGVPKEIRNYFYKRNLAWKEISTGTNGKRYIIFKVLHDNKEDSFKHELNKKILQFCKKCIKENRSFTQSDIFSIFVPYYGNNVSNEKIYWCVDNIIKKHKLPLDYDYLTWEVNL